MRRTDGEHGDGDGRRGSDLHELLGDDGNPVIDAVNDASTGQPGQAGTFNVSTNDKFPVGSTFTQTATTCVPAGTMTGAGVANFTRDDGRELHGDVQRVRTGAEHDDLRHGGADGDGRTAPALTVTKSATPAVLVVKPRVRVYTITIAWPMDRRRRRSTSVTYCRRGVSTNGAITATGGTSLAVRPVGRRVWRAARCVGHQWPVVITVPVAVAADAANPTVNTATVTGGGDPTLHELLRARRRTR